MPNLLDLRKRYHLDLCSTILGIRPDSTHFNNADSASKWSIALASGMAERMGAGDRPPFELPSGQGSGSLFAAHTNAFLKSSFALLHHLRPGDWTFSTSQMASGISAYDQYRHIAELRAIAERYPEVKASLGGDYVITPDIVVTKDPLSDPDIDSAGQIIGGIDGLARLTPFRAASNPTPLPTLHASISCKWTIRSDRAQNTRTEALNLIRNRKGKTPMIIVVTAEPLPRRISSIAVGTGDVDCTYHAALYELLETAAQNKELLGDQLAELETLIQGRRLRDISDLPFDLAI